MSQDKQDQKRMEHSEYRPDYVGQDDIGDFNYKHDRKRNWGPKKPCRGTCGKLYTTTTLRKHGGKCQRCHDAEINLIGHYTQEGLAQKTFYSESKHSLAGKKYDDEDGDPYQDGDGWSKQDKEAVKKCAAQLESDEEEEERPKKSKRKHEESEAELTDESDTESEYDEAEQAYLDDAVDGEDAEYVPSSKCKSKKKHLKKRQRKH